MTAASDLVATAQAQLRDVTGDNWAPATLLDYLNYAVRALVGARPAIHTKVEKVALVPGVLQSLPTDGIQIVDVRYALDGSDALVRGCTQFDRRSMNSADPKWMSATAGPVRQWAPGENLTKQWYCYPPQPDPALKAEIEYSYEPSDIGFDADIPVPSTWDSALLDYVMARALSEDSEVSDNTRASMHMNSFNNVAFPEAQASG